MMPLLGYAALACPPSERMKYLQAGLWKLPRYTSQFTPETPEINAELEVLDFLYGLVSLLKPKVIVETGSYCGLTAATLVLAARQNGIGCVYTCDTDPAAFAETKRVLSMIHTNDAPNSQVCWYALLGPALEVMHEAIADADLLFSDSSYESRMEEVKLLKPGAVGVLHDTGMEEHLDRHIRALYPGSVFIPTPRGLTIFQKQDPLP